MATDFDDVDDVQNFRPIPKCRDCSTPVEVDDPTEIPLCVYCRQSRELYYFAERTARMEFQK